MRHASHLGWLAVAAAVSAPLLAPTLATNWAYQRGEGLHQLLLFAATHTNTAHAALNLAGLACLVLLFRKESRGHEALALLAGLSLLTGLGTHLLTDIQWARGLSGPLHGLFVVWLLEEWRSGERRAWTLLLAAGFGIKLGFDVGSAGATDALIGSRILWEQHVLGTVAGAVVAVRRYTGPVLPRWRFS